MKTYEPALGGGGKVNPRNGSGERLIEPTRSIVDVSAAAISWRLAFIALRSATAARLPEPHAIILERLWKRGRNGF
jgi:hypothetical protein